MNTRRFSLVLQDMRLAESLAESALASEGLARTSALNGAFRLGVSAYTHFLCELCKEFSIVIPASRDLHALVSVIAKAAESPSASQMLHSELAFSKADTVNQLIEISSSLMTLLSDWSKESVGHAGGAVIATSHENKLPHWSRVNPNDAQALVASLKQHLDNSIADFEEY